MARIACLDKVEALAEALELPFRVELCDGAGEGCERVLALCASRTTAYAVYYSALREHFGRRVSLRRGEAVLATTQLT